GATGSLGEQPVSGVDGERWTTPGDGPAGCTAQDAGRTVSGMLNSGGVTSFSSTSTHAAWRTAGERTAQATTSASRASPAAPGAVPSIACTAVTPAPSRRSLTLAGALAVQLVERLAEVLAVLGGQLLRTDQVRQQRRQVAVEEFVGGLLESL